MVSDPNPGGGSAGSGGTDPAEGSDAVPRAWSPPSYTPPTYTPPSYTPPPYPDPGWSGPSSPGWPGGSSGAGTGGAGGAFGAGWPSPPPPPPPGYGAPAGLGPPGGSSGGFSAPPPPPSYAAYPQSYGYGYGGYAGAAPRTDGTAIAALVLSIVSFVFCPIVLSVVALALIPGSRRRIEASGGAITGGSMLTAAKWVAIANIGVFVLVILAVVAFSGSDSNNALQLLPSLVLPN